MFTKTQKRIYNTLMGISAILVVLIITAAATILPGLFFNAYKSQATNKLDRSFYAARVYVDSVMSTVDNLAANTQVIDAVTSGSANGITTLLDDARTYGNYINAVTLYGASGKVYANSDVVNPPTLSRLKQDAHIADFIADDNATDYVSVRTDAVAEAFGNTPYDSERGIVSYCRKIYDNNAVVGYIFADLFPETIFDYFDFGADSRLAKSMTILAYDGGYIANDTHRTCRTIRQCAQQQGDKQAFGFDGNAQLLRRYDTYRSTDDALLPSNNRSALPNCRRRNNADYSNALYSQTQRPKRVRQVG